MSETSSGEEEEVLQFQRVDKVARDSEASRQALRRERSVATAIASSHVPKLRDAADLASDDVDDTDGLDPEREFRDWQARERARCEREIREIEEREAEIEERLTNRAKRKKM